MANGGQIELYAPDVSIASDLSARSGRIAAGNVYEGIDRDAMIPAVANASARLIVAPGVLLDVSGAWVNARRDPATAGDLAYRNGGQIVLRGTEDAGRERQRAECGFGRRNRRIRQIDRRPGRRRQRGVGSFPGWQRARAGRVGVTLDGTAHAYGVTGSGTFRLSSDKVRIGGAGAAQPGVIVLSESLFAQGFSRYEINGNAGLEIADGAMVRPSCRFIVRVQSTLTPVLPAWPTRWNCGRLPCSRTRSRDACPSAWAPACP